MAFRRRRFGRRPKLPVRWTGNFTDAETTTAAGAVGSLTLIDPSDYRQQATMEESGATLLRVRGFFCARATVIGALAHIAIYVPDEALTVAAGGALDPTQFGNFIRGDLIFHGVFTVPVGANAAPLMVPIDVKARRRLADQNVMFAIKATAQAVTWTMSGRCLLRGA